MRPIKTCLFKIFTVRHNASGLIRNVPLIREVMELVHEFKTALKNLYRSKPPIPRARIQLVASVAIKANKMYKHVVMYLEKYAEKIPAKYKLTALCVIDSIIRMSIKDFGKNKDVYAPRFKKKLKFIFQFLKKCKQRDKSRMVRILTLWQKHKIFKSELVELLLSIISPELKSHRKPRGPDKPAGAVHSVAANALAIIHQQQTQIQALQQLQALKNLNSLTPNFVNAIQTLQLYQQQIANGNNVEIPPQLIDQLRLLQSLVQQSTDPQPLDYRGLLRTDYHEVQESAEYCALPSSFDLPGISNAPPVSPRDRNLAPYHSISSNKAHPVGGGPTPILDDFDYGDDEDDAERIAAQKRRVEQEKKRVELAARESARARERNRRKKRKEVKKKKSVPGNATPTQDEVDSPKRYKNQDIDNELERLLMSSAVKLGALASFQDIHQVTSRVPLSPVSPVTSPSRIPALFNHVPISPISVAKSPSSADNEDIVMEEYFNRSPSNVSDEFANDSQRLVICTEEQKETTPAENGEDALQDSEPVSAVADQITSDEEKGATEDMVTEEIAPDDVISLPDLSLTMDETEVAEVVDSPLFSDSQGSLREDTDGTETDPQPEKVTETANDEVEQNNISPVQSPGEETAQLECPDLCPVSQEMEHSNSPDSVSAGTPGEDLSPPNCSPTSYDPLFPTRDPEDMFLQITPIRLPSVSPRSPYASSLEEVCPDLGLQASPPSPSDISQSAEGGTVSPVTTSPKSPRSLSSVLVRNPSPPSSPIPISPSPTFPKSIFDVALPFDNITPPHSSSSSCISDVTPVRENSLECVTPPVNPKNSPLGAFLQSVRDTMSESVQEISQPVEREKVKSIITPNKLSLALRSVIVVKNNKINANKTKRSKHKKQRRVVSSPSSSSLSSSESSSSSSSSSEDSEELPRRKQNRKDDKKSKHNKLKLSRANRRDRDRTKADNVRSKKRPKKEKKREKSPSYRRVRRVRSKSLEPRDRFCPPNKKDCLVIYTNIIKVVSSYRLVEKYHLRKYISAYVGDIELFDITKDHTAALIQLSNRKSANNLKQKLECSDFECAWVPGFKLMPGIYWDSVNGVTYIPWIKVTDEPPYNVFSLQKGGTIDFSEIKKELELIDQQRALEREAQSADQLPEEEPVRAPDKKEKPTIRLCCQDSEFSDSSSDSI